MTIHKSVVLAYSSDMATKGRPQKRQMVMATMMPKLMIMKNDPICSVGTVSVCIKFAHVVTIPAENPNTALEAIITQKSTQ